jgi:formate-dependent nitrite reductase membrane component NrfD
MLGVAAGGARDYVPEVVELVFLFVTVFLLIHDLGRPERFWRLLLKPNTKSWLVKGGWFLTGFGAVAAASLGARWLGMDGVADALRWVNVPLAVMASGYSAFLFAQCRGRDAWISRVALRFASLFVNAAALGVCLLFLLPMREDRTFDDLTRRFVMVGPVLYLIVALLLTERDAGPRSRAAVVGRLAYWLGVMALLVIAPPLAAAAVIAYQLHHDRAWIRAGQAALIS